MLDDSIDLVYLVVVQLPLDGWWELVRLSSVAVELSEGAEFAHMKRGDDVAARKWTRKE